MDIYKELKKYIIEEGINSVIKRFGHVWPEKGIRWMADLDPSPTKKYIEWYINSMSDDKSFGFDEIMKEYIEEDNFASWLHYFRHVKNSFDRFYALTKNHRIRGKQADIWSYENWRDLTDHIEKFENERLDKDEKIIKKETSKKQIDNWLAVMPITKEQCIVYGQGTKWCISAKVDNQFDRYYSDYNIFIIINKNNDEKFAILISKHDKSDLMIYNAENLLIVSTIWFGSFKFKGGSINYYELLQMAGIG